MSAPASPPLVGGEPGAPAGGHPHTISPPTPAPSPQPSGLSRLASASASSASAALVSALPTDGATLRKYVSLIFPSLISSERLQVLSEMLAQCSLRELAQLQSDIAPRLKVDFLSALPIEISLHVLGFIDNPRTLARASAVSRFWRSLVNDEHTWKAMCSKYAFRLRRASMSASQNGPFLHVAPALGSLPSQAAGAATTSSSSRLGTTRDVSRASFSDEDIPEEDALMDEEDANERLDDGHILSSLYERYRARGLDPSNALHELRTLHDLFLAKQADGGVPSGAGSGSDALGVGLGKSGRASIDMSEADRTFYRQLEEIVAEESRERYGEEAIDGTGDEVYDQPLGQSSATSPSVSTQLGSEAAQRTPDLAATTPGNWGWLSAGSFANLPGSRMLPSWPASRTAREGTAVTAGLGALTSPLRDRAALPQTSESVARSRGGMVDDSTDALGDGDVDMVNEEDRSDATALVARSTARLDQGPLHPSPPVASGSAPQRRAGEGQNRKLKRRSAPGQPHVASSSDVFQSGSSSANKAAQTSSFALGRPSWLSGANAKANRSATYAEGLPTAQTRSAPFSYKTHFKLAYLTESNWRKGGRLLTRYTSTEGGAVVTSLAVDHEWIVVGMANAKIHVFDAQTGLYARTLIGHETGVWALTLVSRSGGKQTRPGSGGPGGKDRQDSSKISRSAARAANGGDLELVEHDLRPTLSAYDDEPLTYAGNTDSSDKPTWSSASDSPMRGPTHLSRSSAAKAVPSRTQSSSGLRTIPPSEVAAGEDETLEWFHKARRAMLRKATSSSNLGTAATALDASSSGSSHPLRGGPISAPAGAATLNAATQSARDFARAQAEAEADAGDVRDAIMATSTAEDEHHTPAIPNHLVDQLDASQSNFFGDSDAGDAPSAWANTTSSLGASPFGSAGTDASGKVTSNANPCGSVKGFGNKDALVVTGGCDRDVRVWNLRTGACEHVMSGHASTVRCLKVIEGRPLAVSGSRDSTVRVWNIQTGELVHQLSGHQHSVRCVEVSGNRIASGSYDCMCRIWDVDTGECVNVLRGHFHQIYAIAFDGVRVATGSLDSTVRIWSASTGECLCVLQGHTSLVGQLQLTDSTLVTGGSDGRVIVFCLNTFTTKARLCAHDNSVTCLQFNDRFIVTGGNDGRVKLWDFATGTLIREMVEPAEAIWKMSFRNDCCIILCRRNGRTSMETISFRPLLDA